MKKESLATVSDSREYAKKFAREFLSEHDLNVHFCTAKFKDSVQIRSRYLRRAHNIQRSLEEVTEDGTLMFFRLKGSAHAVKELYEHLVQTSGMPEKLLDLKINRGWLDLPPFLSQERDFLQLLEDFRVEGGVYEILPFREKEGTYQIVEYTPLESKD